MNGRAEKQYRVEMTHHEIVCHASDPLLPACIAERLFHDIPADLFSVPGQRWNFSYVPRCPRLRTAVRCVGVFLRRCGIDRAVDLPKAVGIDLVFGNAGSLPPSEIEDVESLLGCDLEVWGVRKYH